MFSKEENNSELVWDDLQHITTKPRINIQQDVELLNLA